MRRKDEFDDVAVLVAFPHGQVGVIQRDQRAVVQFETYCAAVAFRGVVVDLRHGWAVVRPRRIGVLLFKFAFQGHGFCLLWVLSEGCRWRLSTVPVARRFPGGAVWCKAVHARTAGRRRQGHGAGVPPCRRYRCAGRHGRARPRRRTAARWSPRRWPPAER